MHAYENIFNLTPPNAVNAEVNANLFAGMAAVQYDANHPGNPNPYVNDGPNDVVSRDTNDPAFKDAWNRIMSKQGLYTR